MENHEKQKIDIYPSREGGASIGITEHFIYLNNLTEEFIQTIPLNILNCINARDIAIEIHD